MIYLTRAILTAIGLSGVANALTNGFETIGTPGCGQATCCQPACKVFWKDSKGCQGDAESAGNCLTAFSDGNDADDTGVDICDGGGMFLCRSAHGHVIYVINTASEVSAAYTPHPEVCTLSGQCGPCEAQHFCGAPQFIGKVGSDGHNCKALNKKLESAQNKPKQC